MNTEDRISRLEDYALDKLGADNYPGYDHRFSLFVCHSCKGNELSLTVEHHTGSEPWDFKGVIWGTCRNCGYMGRLFTFSGEGRDLLREERPQCDCGSKVFLAAMLERYEGEEGIPGFFDEGVVVGHCPDCGSNRVIVNTD